MGMMVYFTPRVLDLRVERVVTEEMYGEPVEITEKTSIGLISFMGIPVTFIGVFFILTGSFGYYNEGRFERWRWVTTDSGLISCLLGFIGILLFLVPLIPSLFGFAAALKGNKGMNDGDNTYAPAGLVIGVTAVAIQVFLLIFLRKEMLWL